MGCRADVTSIGSEETAAKEKEEGKGREGGDQVQSRWVHLDSRGKPNACKETRLRKRFGERTGEPWDQIIGGGEGEGGEHPRLRMPNKLPIPPIIASA